eukprot:gene36189-62201_t
MASLRRFRPLLCSLLCTSPWAPHHDGVARWGAAADGGVAGGPPPADLRGARRSVCYADPAFRSLLHAPARSPLVVADLLAPR